MREQENAIKPPDHRKHLVTSRTLTKIAEREKKEGGSHLRKPSMTGEERNNKKQGKGGGSLGREESRMIRVVSEEHRRFSEGFLKDRFARGGRGSRLCSLSGVVRFLEDSRLAEGWEGRSGQKIDLELHDGVRHVREEMGKRKRWDMRAACFVGGDQCSNGE